MPFKSEKQRRYLWANEPKIARDWADTYGSRIEKNDGGITQLVKSEQDRMGAAFGGIMGADGRRGYVGGSYSTAGTSDKSERGSYQGRDDSGGRGGTYSGSNQGPDSSYVKPAQQASHERVVAEAKRIVELKKKAKKKKKASLPFWKGAAYGLTTNKKKVAAIRSQYRDYLKSKGVTNIPTTLNDENLYSFYESDAFNYEPGPVTETFMDEFDTPHQKTRFDVQNYGDWMAEYQGSPGIKHSGNLGEVGEKYVKTRDEVTGKPLTYGYHEKRGDGQGGGYMGYPSYAAWQAAQGGGGGGGTTTATTAASTPSAFQQSLTTGTTGVSSPFDYYVGQDPTAANLAWGEKFGVDPRTMYKTSWADGGRIGRAYGGIMDSSTGRRAYGFGSIFSKIGKAAKKVLKSPIGKAALIGGLGAWGMGAGPFANVAGQGWLKGALAQAGSPNQKAGWLRNIFSGGKGALESGWNPWKIGIGALGALPFFMGGDEDKEEGFDYEGAKNKYWDELMRIKSGAMAGSLDPTKFNYLGVRAKDGGRIGLYAGGQSTPSDYTMEDAMMTTTQDKLGGITDVMKQADLSRQGSVGQFYAAQGGRIGYDEGGPAEIGGDNISEVLKRVQELEDEGLDFGAAMAQAMKELSQGKAHGGRIGYADAGDVRKDPEEVAKTIGGEYQDRGIGTWWPYSLFEDDRAEWAGEEMVEEMQDYKYGKSYPGETEWRKDKNKNIGGYGSYPKSDRDPMSMEDTIAALEAKWEEDGPSSYFEGMGIWKKKHIRRRIELGWEEARGPVTDTGIMKAAHGGRIGAEEGGLMDLGGMEKDYRNDGGFVPLGGEEKADDVPARLSKNEFVFTADAVRGAGGGDIDKGAEIMENIMKNLEQGGQISEETQGNTGAQGMFDVSERLGEVI